MDKAEGEVLIGRERDTIRAKYGARNKTASRDEWIGLFARRLGHLARAAATLDPVWFTEELVKLAATAQCAVEAQAVSFSEGAGSFALIVGSDRPQVVDKVMAPPSSAVRVAGTSERVWVGPSGVYVERGE